MSDRSATPSSEILSGASIGLLGGVGLAAVGTWSSPYVALAGLLSALGGIGVLLRPELGIYLTAFVIPLERLGRFTDDTAAVPISLMRIVGTGAFAVYALHFLVARRRPYIGRQGLVLLGFISLVAASNLWTTDPFNTKVGLSLWLGNLLFFLLIVNAVRSTVQVRRLLVIVLVSSTLAGAYSLYQWQFGSRLQSADASAGGRWETKDRFSAVYEDTTEFAALGDRPRLAGTTGHPTVYAANLLCLLPMAVFLFYGSPRLLPRLAVGTAVAILGVNLFLTGTRAAMLVVIPLGIGLLVLGLIRIRASTIAAVLLAAAIVPWVIPPKVVERIFYAENYTIERAGSIRARFCYWESGATVFAHHWLLGVGFANMQEMPKGCDMAPREGSSVHNSLLQLAMELGVVGLATFLTFLGMALRNARHAARRFRARGRGADVLCCHALLLTLIAPVLLGFTADWHHFPMKTWWLAVGLLDVMRRLADGTLAEEAPTPLLPSVERLTAPQTRPEAPAWT